MLAAMRWWLTGLIVLVAAWLRLHDLEARVMHGDEANQAVKFGDLLEHGIYRFNPQDHHGPTLYYLTLPVAWVRGERTLAEVTETTVRLVPVIAGVLSVALVAVLASPWGRLAAAAAALLMAIAPAAVYYQRYYIQESLLVAFTLATFVCARRWWQHGGIAWAITTGICVGLMQATKASAPLFLIAAGVALIVIRGHPTPDPPDPTPRPWRRDGGLALLAAFGVAALFYSSFLTHPAGLRDAVLTYFPAGERVTGGAGHEKPWHYYAQLFLPHSIGGYHWNQSAFLALALLGLSACWWAPRVYRPPVRFWSVYLIGLGLLFSAIPYKTPWLVLNLLPGLVLLGAAAVGALAARGLRGTAVAVIVLVATAWMQVGQLKLAVYLRPGDTRNPLAYVHPSPDVRKVRPLVESARRQDSEGIVRIISAENWPLPWYLRGLEGVGYWTSPPEDCDGAVVIVAADLAEIVRDRLKHTYEESYLGLRPGFVMITFTREP